LCICQKESQQQDNKLDLNTDIQLSDFRTTSKWCDVKHASVDLHGSIVQYNYFQLRRLFHSR